MPLKRRLLILVVLLNVTFVAELFWTAGKAPDEATRLALRQMRPDNDAARELRVWSDTAGQAVIYASAVQLVAVVALLWPEIRKGLASLRRDRVTVINRIPQTKEN